MVQRNRQLFLLPTWKKTCETATLLKGGCRSLPSATFQALDTISQSRTSTSSSVMAIDLGHANVKDQKHVTRLAPKNYQEKWLQKVMLGLCSRLTGWGVLKPHRQLTQATVHHALNFNLPKDNETNPAMQGNATVGSAELKTISNVLSDRSAQRNGKGDADRQASLSQIHQWSNQAKKRRKSTENALVVSQRAGPQKGHRRTHGKLRTLNVQKAQRAKIELFHWNLVDGWPSNRLL